MPCRHVSTVWLGQFSRKTGANFSLYRLFCVRDPANGCSSSFSCSGDHARHTPLAHRELRCQSRSPDGVVKLADLRFHVDWTSMVEHAPDPHPSVDCELFVLFFALRRAIAHSRSVGIFQPCPQDLRHPFHDQLAPCEESRWRSSSATDKQPRAPWRPAITGSWFRSLQQL